MSVNVLLELAADLALGRLVLDESVLQQLLGARPLLVILDQTHLHKALELL